jgi:hypothetical protein
MARNPPSQRLPAAIVHTWDGIGVAETASSMPEA